MNESNVRLIDMMYPLEVDSLPDEIVQVLSDLKASDLKDNLRLVREALCATTLSMPEGVFPALLEYPMLLSNGSVGVTLSDLADIAPDGTVIDDDLVFRAVVCGITEALVGLGDVLAGHDDLNGSEGSFLLALLMAARESAKAALELSSEHA